MFTSGSFRRRRVASTTVVLLQVAILCMSLLGPAFVSAAEPSADPSPDPSPSAQPTSEPSPDATPAPTAEPTVEPTADPTPAPTPGYVPSGPASIASDQADYPPGGTVTLTGSNWFAGEIVHIFVNDDFGSSWSRNVDVTADAGGRISDHFDLPAWFVADYSVKATGTISGTAITSFTDGNVKVKSAAGRDFNFFFTVYPNSTNCTGQAVPVGSIAADGNGINVGAGNAAQSAEFVANANANAPNASAAFVNWSNPDGLTITQGTLLTRTICVTGFNTGTKDLVGNYAPAAATTTTVVSSANPSTYGSSVTFTATISPSPSGAGTVTFKDGLAILCSTAAVTGAAASCVTSSLAVGSHSITAEYSGAPGFAASTSPTLTQVVNKKALTVTATNDSKVYGSVNPSPLVFGYSGGFVGTDTAAGIDTPPTCSSTATTTTPVGTAPITCSGGVDNNYVFIYVAGTLTITSKALSVNAVADSKTYGDADPVFTWTYSGFITGENSGNVTITGDASCSRTFGESVAGSPYTITCAPGDLSAANYSFVTGSTADFTIDLRPATWTTDPSSKTYGDADPSPLTTGSGSGFLVADGVSATYSRAPGETVAGSPYHISATLSSTVVDALDNYDITNAEADFTIDRAVLSVNAAPNAKTYGDADPTFGYTLTGYKFGENATGASVTGSASCTRTLGQSFAGSPYTITCAPGDLSAANYSFVTGSTADFTINRRPATWTTNPNSKVLGAADPVPLTTGSGTNFLVSDGVGATYTRVAGETVGGYHVTATLSSSVAGTLNNYTITNTGATFNIYFLWDGFLQPINDTAHQTGVAESKFKLGQTIPAKFVIKDAAGNILQQSPLPTFTRSNRLGSCDASTAPEAILDLSPDAGSNYQWQGGQYHYNWSTKGLTAGEYRIYANLADGTARFVDVCLTK